MVASESQSGSKKPVGIEGVEPQMSVSYSLRAKHLLSGVKPPWLAADPVGGSGEWAEEMGMCWTLCQVAKPVPCRLHCTGIDVGILCFFLFLPSVTLVITGEMYFCT